MATNTINRDASQKLDLNRVLLVIAVLAVLPVAVVYLARMWVEGHYQFFPLYIAVVGYLFYGRFDKIAADTKPGNRVAASMLFVGCSLLIFSAAIFESAFLGAVSMYVLFASVIYWLMDVRGLIKSMPFLLLLLLAIPLPGNIDNLLIIQLQFMASQFAGWLLDLFGLIHFREGVVLITNEQQFFTEEACSGIRSLYSSIAGIAVYSATCRYGWARAIFNIIQTFLWVIFGNALRIAIVVGVSENWTTSIAEGLPHDLLGLAIFVVIMLLAISTDRLVSSMFPYVEHESEIDDSVIEVTPVFHKRQLWSRLGLNRFAVVLIGLFLMVLIVGCRMAFVSFTQDRSLISILDRRLPMMVEGDMPVAIGSWKRGEYERVRRGHSSIFAQDSFVWHYEHSTNGLSAVVSVDCPWHGFHDLVVCYEVKGWRNTADEFHEVGDLKYKSVELSRFSGAEALLVYAGMDRNARNVAPPKMTDTLDARTRWLAGFRQLTGADYSSQIEAAGIELPVTMVQIYCEGGGELTSELKAEVRQLFQRAHDLIKQSRRFKTADSTANGSVD